MSFFHHLAHLKYPPLVKVGDWVKRGQLIGYVGNTGNSKGAHLHYEIQKSEPKDWNAYIKGWTLAQVKARYENPKRYIKDGIPADFTYAGWRFLQWEGTGYHPGIDLNSTDDEGKNVFSPVEGRVRYVAGVEGWRQVLRNIFPQYFNHGWGNHVFIEQSPNFKL